MSAVILALPEIFGVDRTVTIAMAVGLASLQAGQAAAVQTDHRNSTKRLFSAALVAASSATGAILLTFPEALSAPEFVALSLIGLGGVVTGIATGGHASELLSGGKRASYQAFILARNLGWLAAIIAFGVVDPKWMMISAPVAWVIFLLIPTRRAVSQTTWATLAAGSLSAMLYRNDVNVVRGMASTQDFRLWHYYLIGYILVQAMLGFLIINELYSRRELIRERATLYIRAAVLAVLVILASAGFAIYFILPDRVGLIIVLAIILPMGVVVAVQAALVHIHGGSNWVYLAGTVGFSVLVVCAVIGMSPEIGFLMELTISGCVAGCGSLIFRNDGSDSTQRSGKHRRHSASSSQGQLTRGKKTISNGAMA
ncbi:hypothetical protein [Williamsia muralis]|uniref:hypothetical protein n=1 Tax=Williamsia marianensis TaxID=85044 RepID=UPI0011C3718B|nr:hypothetical protein [Williamsia muralis]